MPEIDACLEPYNAQTKLTFGREPEACDVRPLAVLKSDAHSAKRARFHLEGYA
jgi:hypothetical protein